MRYNIIASSPISLLLAKKLEQEICRFDIRAEVQCVKLNKEINSRESDTNIYLDLPNRIKLKDKKSKSFILQQLSRSWPSIKRWDSSNYHIYPDLPFSMDQNSYQGCHLFDLLKGIEIESSEAGLSPCIMVLSGFDNRRLQWNRWINSPSISMKNVLFEYRDLENDLEKSASKIKNANAAIVTSAIGELVALFYNVPFIRVFKKGLFTRNKTKSIINALATKDFINVISIMDKEAITQKLNQILGDHQYCASILEQFQLVKDKLGTQSSIRNIARDIVEKVED